MKLTGDKDGETRYIFHEFEETHKEQRREIDRILSGSDRSALLLLLAIVASWGAIIWGIVRLAHRFFGL